MKDRSNANTMINSEVAEQREIPHWSCWPRNQNNLSNLYTLVSGLKIYFCFSQAHLLMILNTRETACRVLKILVF